GSILSACPGGDAATFLRHGCRLESSARACPVRLGSGCRSRFLVEHGVSRRRSLMSRPTIAYGSAHLAAIPPVRACAAITDAFLTPNPTDSTIGGADGGGDIDISVGFPTNPDSIPVVTIASLAAANISTAYSFDRGVTFQKAPATVVGTADDRMWNESTGPS